MTPLDDSRVLVEFRLTSPSRQELDVELEFSEDKGRTFAAATTEVDPARSIDAGRYAATSSGRDYELVWDASSDLETLAQHDLVLRVTPFRPASLDSGRAATSEVFGLGSNSPPIVAYVSSPANEVGGHVKVSCAVVDAEGDHVTIQAEFSTDGGTSYSPATLDGADSVMATAAGVAHTVTWDAQSDAPESSSSSTILRLRAVDTDAGDFLASSPFSIRTYAPRIDLLTVNGIPAAMNGSTDFVNSAGTLEAFALLLPEHDFAIEVNADPHPSGVALDPDGLTISSSTPLGGGSATGGVDAGEDFASLLSFETATGSGIVAIPEEMSFPEGTHTLTASIRDVLGNESAPARLTFTTVRPTDAMRPFEKTDVWFLDFARDNFTIEATTNGTGSISIAATSEKNGVSDFVEDLRILGLNAITPPPDAADANLNGVVASLVESSIVGFLNSYFGHEPDGTRTEDSANIEFVLDDPGTNVSRIGIGGDDPIPGFTIGRAEFDYRNGNRNDNTDVDLGIFSTNLIDFYVNTSFTFKNRFDALVPGRGIPVGHHPADLTVLDEAFDRESPLNSADENTRYDEIALSIESFSRVVATILAHEIGHSLGLVANGAPWGGLFGGENNASFAGPYTTTFHVDTQGNNIMAAAISFSGAIQTGAETPRFNNLNRAYLLERIVLD